MIKTNCFLLNLIGLLSVLLFIAAPALAKTNTLANDSGFCCFNGKLKETSEKECGKFKGKFYPENKKSQAQKECSADTAGYCCSNGTLKKATESACTKKKGDFYPEKLKSTAIKKCAESLEGYCCKAGTLSSSTAGSCKAVKGAFYPEKKKSTAQKECAASAPGYCCSDGQLKSSTPQICKKSRGTFYPEKDKKRAKKECAENAAGYCCKGGNLKGATEKECGKVNGKFYPQKQKSIAKKECAASAPGYCCDNGKLSKSTVTSCQKSKGKFYPEGKKRVAEKACSAVSSGYCCSDGNISQSTQNKCLKTKGTFYEDFRVAKKQCAVSQNAGFCCVNGKIDTNNQTSCDRLKGTFYTDKKKALSFCKQTAAITTTAINRNQQEINKAPDLTIKSIKLAGKSSANSKKQHVPAKIIITVKNTSKQKSDKSTLKMTIISKGKANTFKPLTESINCPPLGANKSTEIIWALPKNLKADGGPYSFIAQIDPKNAVLESNEKNNILRYSFSPINSSPQINRVALAAIPVTNLPDNTRVDRTRLNVPRPTNEPGEQQIETNIRGTILDTSGNPVVVENITFQRIGHPTPRILTASVSAGGSYATHILSSPNETYYFYPVLSHPEMYEVPSPQIINTGEDEDAVAHFVLTPIAGTQAIGNIELRTHISGAVTDNEGNRVDIRGVQFQQAPDAQGNFRTVVFNTDLNGQYFVPITDTPDREWIFFPLLRQPELYTTSPGLGRFSPGDEEITQDFIITPKRIRTYKTTVNGTLNYSQPIAEGISQIRLEIPNGESPSDFSYHPVAQNGTFSIEINSPPGITCSIQPVITNPDLFETTVLTAGIYVMERNSEVSISYDINVIANSNQNESGQCRINGLVLVNDNLPLEATYNILPVNGQELTRDNVAPDGTFSQAVAPGVYNVWVHHRSETHTRYQSDVREVHCSPAFINNIVVDFLLSRSRTSRVEGRVLNNGHVDEKIIAIHLQRLDSPQSTTSTLLQDGRFLFDVEPDVSYILTPDVPEALIPVEKTAFKLSPGQEVQIANINLALPELFLGDLKPTRYTTRRENQRLEFQLEANLLGGNGESFSRDVRLYSREAPAIDLRQRCTFTPTGGRCIFQVPLGGYGFSNTTLTAEIVGLEASPLTSKTYPDPFELVNTNGDLNITSFSIKNENREISIQIDNIDAIPTRACRIGIKVNNSAPQYSPIPTLLGRANYTVAHWVHEGLEVGDRIVMQIDNDCDQLSGNNRSQETIIASDLYQDGNPRQTTMTGESDWGGWNPLNWF